MAQIYLIGHERYSLVLDAGVVNGSRVSLEDFLGDAGLPFAEVSELFIELEADTDRSTGAHLALPRFPHVSFPRSNVLELDARASWDDGEEPKLLNL